MLRQACAVALAAATTLSLPAGTVVAQDAIDQAQVLTQATYRRIVDVRFESAPSEVIPNLLTRVDLFDPTISEVRFDHSQSETPGEMGVGSRRICIFTDGRELVEPLLVYDPPRAYAYTVDAQASTMALPVREILLFYAFQDDGDGTLVTIHAFYDPSIPVTGPVIEPVLTGTLRRTCQTAAQVFGGAYIGDRKP
ncbi:MAG: SRPBCC family protein [Pseudomonadota bacterium]